MMEPIVQVLTLLLVAFLLFKQLSPAPSKTSNSEVAAPTGDQTESTQKNRKRKQKEKGKHGDGNNATTEQNNAQNLGSNEKQKQEFFEDPFENKKLYSSAKSVCLNFDELFFSQFPAEKQQTTSSSPAKQDFSKLSGLFDVSFTVGSENRIIKAHKVILSAQSEYFYNMFNSGSSWKETSQNQIQKPNVENYESFEQLIRYFYSGRMKFDNIEQLLYCIKYAKELNVENAILYIDQDVLPTFLTLQNCVQVLVAIYKMVQSQYGDIQDFEKMNSADKKLIGGIIAYIGKQALKVFRRKQKLVSIIPEQLFLEFLQSSDVICSEEFLFELSVLWGKYHDPKVTAAQTPLEILNMENHEEEAVEDELNKLESEESNGEAAKSTTSAESTQQLEALEDAEENKQEHPSETVEEHTEGHEHQEIQQEEEETTEDQMNEEEQENEEEEEQEDKREEEEEPEHIENEHGEDIDAQQAETNAASTTITTDAAEGMTIVLENIYSWKEFEQTKNDADSDNEWENEEDEEELELKQKKIDKLKQLAALTLSEEEVKRLKRKLRKPLTCLRYPVMNIDFFAKYVETFVPRSIFINTYKYHATANSNAVSFTAKHPFLSRQNSVYQIKDKKWRYRVILDEENEERTETQDGEDMIQEYISKPFLFQNIQWYLVVKLTPTRVQMYLHQSEAQPYLSLPRKTTYVTFKLTGVNQLNYQESFMHDQFVSYQFDPNSTDGFGWDRLGKYKDFKDPSKGFIVDGVAIFDCEFMVVNFEEEEESNENEDEFNDN